MQLLDYLVCTAKTYFKKELRLPCHFQGKECYFCGFHESELSINVALPVKFKTVLESFQDHNDINKFVSVSEIDET